MNFKGYIKIQSQITHILIQPNIKTLPKAKMQKPRLKTQTIKIQPSLSNDYQDHFDQDEESKLEPIEKILKLRITRSKRLMPSKPKSIEDQSAFLVSDHILGRGFISHKVLYLYLAKGQIINKAKWIQAQELGRKTKSGSLIYTLFEARLISNNKILSCKKKPFIDVDYIHKFLSLKDKRRNSNKSIKTRVQELESKFIYNFQTMKFKITGVQQVRDRPQQICKIIPQQNIKSLPKKRQSAPKTVIKFEHEQESMEKSMRKDQTSSSQIGLGEALLKRQRQSSQISRISQKKLINTQNRLIKELAIINNIQSDQFKPDSFDTLSSKQISFSLSQRHDHSKQEVTGVNYMGRIKQNRGNYENLYRFSLKYHPEIYSTMKIIKEDDFLRDAFIKFAEPLYEQFNDKKAK